MTTKETKPVTTKIATLNDLCRKAMGVAGLLMQTQGINALSLADQAAIRANVEAFADFAPDKSPYLDHNGVRTFWKIDYYDTTLNQGSEDPSDPKQTVRVLTIMLASE